MLIDVPDMGIFFKYNIELILRTETNKPRRPSQMFFCLFRSAVTIRGWAAPNQLKYFFLCQYGTANRTDIQRAVIA